MIPAFLTDLIRAIHEAFNHQTMIHLRLNIYNGYAEHPQQTMKRFGITYQCATPQSISDEWIFWNCENAPNPLPQHLTILSGSPFDFIGWGLTKEKAETISNYLKPNQS